MSSIQISRLTTWRKKKLLQFYRILPTVYNSPLRALCPLSASEFKHLAKWSRKLSQTPIEFGPKKRLNLTLPTPLRCMDGVKDIAPHILIHSAGWMCVVKLTPSPLLPREAGWAQSQSGRSGEETTSDHSAHRIGTTLSTLSQVQMGPTG